MKELFVMLAKAMSKDQVIEKIETAIADYKEAVLLNESTERSLHNLDVSVHLYIMNGLDKNPEEIIKDMDKVNRRVKFFDTEIN